MLMKKPPHACKLGQEISDYSEYPNIFSSMLPAIIMVNVIDNVMSRMTH